MKRLGLFLFNLGVMAGMPAIAGAAGTYFNGNTYQSPQKYANMGGGYYGPYAGGRGYGQYGQPQYVNDHATMVRTTTTKKTTKTATRQKNETRKQGFALDLGFSHEFANWNFEMKDAGSKLHYDDLSWNVLSGEGVYYFGNETPMQIKLGARYGKQFGDSPMIDDDITSGAYGYQDIDDGRAYGHAMSLGTSKDGTQMGYNISFGLTDFFTWGRVKATPSIGYRYFKHELKTQNNYGLTMDTFSGNSNYQYVSCINAGGETQCDPLVIAGFYNIVSTENGDVFKLLDYEVIGRLQYDDGTLTPVIFGAGDIPSETQYVTIDLGDTYYYEQSGTSHKYETEWAGPYLALDMEYAINDTNFINAGIEFGLPIYDSKGNQPYRIDWAHPTSVEDKASMGDAYHLGLNALWSTQITDTMNFTLGMTYDFYKVSGADAKTFLNGTYYQNILTGLQNEYDDYAALETPTQEQIAYKNELANQINVLNSQKSAGWTITSKNEIESIYRAMGIRAGISVKF